MKIFISCIIILAAAFAATGCSRPITLFEREDSVASLSQAAAVQQAKLDRRVAGLSPEAKAALTGAIARVEGSPPPTTATATTAAAPPVVYYAVPTGTAQATPPRAASPLPPITAALVPPYAAAPPQDGTTVLSTTPNGVVVQGSPVAGAPTVAAYMLTPIGGE